MVGLEDVSVDTIDNTALAAEIFDREGVLVVRKLLPSSLVGTVNRFLSGALDQLDALFRQHGFSLHDADAAARLSALVERQSVSLPERDKHVFLGHFPLEVRLAETLKQIPRFLNGHPLLFELLHTRRLFAHMPPTARFVLPGCTLARVPPHQDISYNRHLGEFCVVWIPLVPIDARCGGMAAYLRTHAMNEVLAEAGNATADGWLRAIETDLIGDARRLALAPLDPGDVVILNRRTIHESMTNNSDGVRLSCDYRFFGERSHSTKHYFDIAADTVVPPASLEAR